MNLLRRLTSLSGCALGIASLTGCGPSNTDNVNIDGDNMKYDIDSRTGVCYAGTGIAKNGEFSTSSMSISYVPCSKEVLTRVPASKLEKLRVAGVKPVAPPEPAN